MNDSYKDFGDFLHQKRMSMKMSYRLLADRLGVSAPYLSDIEKGRRNAPSREKLELIAEVFHLTEEERMVMYDLAGEKKDELAPDIPDYIKANSYVVSALRTARDFGASEQDWRDFVERLKAQKDVDES